MKSKYVETTNVVAKNKNKKLLKKKNGCQRVLFSLFFLFFLLCFPPQTSGQYQVYRQDPFALLSATLQVIIPSFYTITPILHCFVYIPLKPFIRCIAYFSRISFIGTLQTYQKAACDGQAINLECPSGTKIAIQLVQYGRSLPSSQVWHIKTNN